MGFTLMFEGEWLLFIELHIKEDFHPGSFSLSLSLPLSGTTHPKGNLKHLDWRYSILKNWTSLRNGYHILYPITSNDPSEK